MCDIEINKCSTCGEKKKVNRKYFNFQFKCECCLNKENFHKEIVYYCNECEPKYPIETTALIKIEGVERVIKITL